MKSCMASVPRESRQSIAYRWNPADKPAALHHSNHAGLQFAVDRFLQAHLPLAFGPRVRGVGNERTTIPGQTVIVTGARASVVENPVTVQPMAVPGE